MFDTIRPPNRFLTRMMADGQAECDAEDGIFEKHEKRIKQLERENARLRKKLLKCSRLQGKSDE